MRRFRPDPLDPIQAPAWMVIRDRHRVLESHRLEPLTNLRIVFMTTVLRRMSMGWLIEDCGPGASVCFATKGDERISISINRTDPNVVEIDDQPTPWSVVPLRRE